MSYIKIHQERIHDRDAAKALCPFGAISENASGELEIGAGCGAVTGLLCRKCDRVVAVDLSKKRSTINATRNRDCDNLEIMVGNFEDIQIEEKFDYVTLIGV